MRLKDWTDATNKQNYPNFKSSDSCLVGSLVSLLYCLSNFALCKVLASFPFVMS